MMESPSATQQLTVLGSTGSIGVSTLEVVSRHLDRFSVFALSASKNVERLLSQCARFRPKFAVMESAAHAKVLGQHIDAEGLDTKVLSGQEGLLAIASHEQVTTVMAAIVGAAGLGPCLAAARTGKRILLANKEALVVGGSFFLDAVTQGSATLIPIDSEHSAIFQSLPSVRTQWPQQIDKLILTASGGPFRTRDPDSFSSITIDEACMHPNWTMGRKISVDSSTMMNKALEVIEAHFLFGVPADRIEAIIHPQSVIHSMVQFVDNSVLAQLGTADMRGPIAYGLSWPERMNSGATPVNFATLGSLTFECLNEPAHQRRFPGVRLAWEALRSTNGTTAVLNTANEVAVASFLEGRIRYDQMHRINVETLNRIVVENPKSLEALLELERATRKRALDIVTELQN